MTIPAKLRVAEQVAQRLEKMIQSGLLREGDRLPAERKFAEQLRVSRPSLREAIQLLTSKGFLQTRPGGGTFVNSIMPKDFSDPMVTLFRDNPEYRFDVLEIRHALEGNAAFYAALRATEKDKQRIKECYQHMLDVQHIGDPLIKAKADAAFHLSIVEASHNLVLLHVMRGLFDLLQNSISHNLDKLYTLSRVFEPLQEQHHDLMQSILNHQPEQARDAAQQHLVFVENAIKDLDEDEARKQRSLNRAGILGPYAKP